MNVLLWFVLWLTPVLAPRPTPTPERVRVFQVDAIILNRVRSSTTTHDRWGRPRTTPSEVWWISFWDRPYSPVPGCWWPARKRTWIDRGWWRMRGKVWVRQSQNGWTTECNRTVIESPELWMIDSPYDFEMRNRGVYDPIR